MDRTKRIAIVRESIVKIAQILSDNKVLVTQAGVKAFVKYDERTHKATRVNLPMIPDDASEELIDSIQGFLDSEISKVLYADGKSNLRANHENMSGLYNPLESFFCEKKMVENFAGSRHNLANMHQTFVTSSSNPSLKRRLQTAPTSKSCSRPWRFQHCVPGAVRSSSRTTCPISGR